MKVKNLAVLAAVGGFALAGSAQANITGLQLTTVDMSAGFVNADGSINVASAAVVGPAFTAANVTVYRVWATVDNALEAVFAAGGSADDPLQRLNMISSTGSFVNDLAFGSLGASGINAALFGVFPTVAWDSYVALGGAESATTPAGFAIQDTGNVLNGLAGSITNGANVAWFTAPPTAGQGIVSDGAGGFRFLLAQLTVTNTIGLNAAAGTVEGDIKVDGSANSVYAHFAVPSPGALALLGLAGLAGSRRRRA